MFDGTEISPVTRTLIDAKGFLEKGWCIKTQGLTIDGTPVSGRDSRAVHWCLYGAIMAATPSDMIVSAVANMIELLLLEHYPDDNPSGSISSFNDTQKTVKPVLKVIDLAIAKSMEK